METSDTHKPFKLGSIAFIFGLLGAMGGFIIDYGPDNILSYVFFWWVVICVVIGFISVIWHFYIILDKSRYK